MCDYGCAVLGSGGGVGGGVGFVGDDSVRFGVVKIGKKRQGEMELSSRASWGAAVLRPYMSERDSGNLEAGEMFAGRREKAERDGVVRPGKLGRSVLRPYMGRDRECTRPNGMGASR